MLDEGYREYISGVACPDSVAHVRAGRPLFVLRIFSKIYGLAGLRVGYGFALPELIRRVHEQRLPFHLSSVALAGAVAALDDEEHVVRSRELVASMRPLLYWGLADLNVDLIESHATFICFALGVDPQAL